jgi:N-acetylmuramoyl-L-alanine amidase
MVPAILAAGLCLQLLAGCAGLPRPAPSPAPPPPVVLRPRPGYDRLADSLAAVDATGLAGRRVVVDPGHGGFFPGALGIHGLTEAEVNLGVALRLRDLLAARGAQVLLTRTEDRDFLTPADSSLRSDLAERARLANAFAPDLFLSIHHNADAGGLHDVNETQTYYKLGDEGPSLEAAQDVHRSLVRNVGIEKNKVVPGNYFVVRSSDAPALLTETSYITDPDVEERLRLPENQQLEAEALFIGLARYFSRPLPVIAALTALDSTGRPSDSIVTVGPGPTLMARIRGAFDFAELELDGVRLAASRTDSTLSWTPDSALAPGAHRLLARARLGGTGSARDRAVTFTLTRPGRRLRWQAFPERAPRAGGPLALRVESVDRFGFVTPDSDSITVRAVCRCDTVRARHVPLDEGRGWIYVTSAPANRRPDARREAIELSLAARGTPSLSARVPLQRVGESGPRGVWITRSPSDTVPGGAPFAWLPTGASRWLDPQGFAVVTTDSLGEFRLPTLAGYRPIGAMDSASGTRLTPLLGGALHGRRITLDPEGGGDDAAGQGPGGTRASNLNLESARILAGFLTAAGAEVKLTRDGDLALSEVERVQVSEAFHSDRFLRIGHRTGHLGYYFSSAAGKRWAQRTAGEFVRLGLPLPLYGEDAAYPLAQTSSPALLASVTPIDRGDGEARLLAPGALRAEAYAILLGLAREWAPAAAWPIDSVEVHDEAGAPLSGVAITLGGAFVIETDALGRARFARTETGPIEATIEDPRARTRRDLLELTRGVVLTGSHGR